MHKSNRPQFGSTLETIMYPFLLLLLMWSIHLLQHMYPRSLYNWGILPKDLIGLRGVLFSPLLHATDTFGHILNNSLPIAVLLGATIYFYREVAGKVFFFSWFSYLLYFVCFECEFNKNYYKVSFYSFLEKIILKNT